MTSATAGVLRLTLVRRRGGNVWLRREAQRGDIVLEIALFGEPVQGGAEHGRFTEYRDLVGHPRERTDEYRKEATSGSILIPLLAAFLSALSDHEALEHLANLRTKELQHWTLQLWMPDRSSEDGIYIGAHDHGLALCDLPLSTTGNELLKTVRDACNQSEDFDTLSAIATSYWPMSLTACRHHRLPAPPQFWIAMVDLPPVS